MKNYTSGVPVDHTANLGTGMLGKKHSEETKRKIGDANRGRHATAETRAKMSLVRKGKQRGIAHPNWKGGEWTDKDGRVYVYRPDHPHANNKGYVFRSRFVMENILGRFLNPCEVVHHKNQNPSDDRPENLELFPSKSAHIAFHNTGKIRGFKMLGPARAKDED